MSVSEWNMDTHIECRSKSEFKKKKRFNEFVICYIYSLIFWSDNDPGNEAHHKHFKPQNLSFISCL